MTIDKPYDLCHLYDYDGTLMCAWYGELPPFLAWKLRDEMNVNAACSYRLRVGVGAAGLGGGDILLPPGDLPTVINRTVARVLDRQEQERAELIRMGEAS